VYPSARITKVNYVLASADIPKHYGLPWASVSVGYNAARWSSGDIARNATYDYQGHEAWSSITTCQTFGGNCQGMEITAEGYGFNGANRNAVLSLHNGNPTSMYMDNNGNPTGLPLPNGINIGTFGRGNPVFQNTFEIGLTPRGCVFCFDGHLPGQTSYTVFGDPSWGGLIISPAGFAFVNTGLRVQNYLSAGSIGTNSLIGPPTAPSGTCGTNGQWELTQDGHATVCLAGNWITKI